VTCRECDDGDELVRKSADLGVDCSLQEVLLGLPVPEVNPGLHPTAWKCPECQRIWAIQPTRWQAEQWRRDGVA
jgi:hypothetical protein